MPLVYLSLGSNLGERCDYLRRAITMLDEHYTIVAVSSVYETAAWGKTDQPDFLNLVLALETPADPFTLLDTIQAIETELGRVRRERWGERTIDIDILFFGDQVIDQPRLSVPHPRLWERAFVLRPLYEIAPTLSFRGRSIQQALADLPGQDVRYYAETATDC